MKLHYESEGDGPLVVLLHGFPQYRAAWRRQLPALAAAGYRAVAPDLRGYGESPKPKHVTDYDIRLIVEDVAELITDLSDEGCILVGHDWGGLVSWLLAMIHPELVRKLVVINLPHPALIARELRRSNQQRMRLSYQLFFRMPVLPELYMRLFGKRRVRKAGNFSREELDFWAAHWKHNITTMLNYYRAMGKTRGLRKLYRRIDVPVMVIWGEDEQVFLPDTLVGTEEWAPNLRVEKIPRIGHFAQHDAAERVNELLVSFVGAPATRTTAPQPS